MNINYVWELNSHCFDKNVGATLVRVFILKANYMPMFKKLSQEKVNLFEVIKPAPMKECTHAMSLVELCTALGFTDSEMGELQLEMENKMFLLKKSRLMYARSIIRRFHFIVTFERDYHFDLFKIKN